MKHLHQPFVWMLLSLCAGLFFAPQTILSENQSVNPKIKRNTGVSQTGAPGTALPASKTIKVPPPNPSPGGDAQPQSIMMESPVQNVPTRLNSPNFVDLAITGISLSTPSPRLEDMFTITVTIQNRGLADQLQGAPVAYFQMDLNDDPYVDYYRQIEAPFALALPPLPAGQVYTYTKTITIPRNYQNIPVQPGAYKLTAIINTSAYQPDDEHNQQNNQAVKQFQVRAPQPSDLGVYDISLTSTCHPKVTLVNDAAAIDQADFAQAKLKIQKGPTVYDQIDLSTADPNGILKQAHSQMVYHWAYNHTTSAAGWTLDLDPGESATYTVTIDPYHAVLDQHGANNTLTKTLTCPQ